MITEESRRELIREQVGSVKRAIAAATELDARSARRQRFGLLLLLLLFFGGWRITRAPVEAAEVVVTRAVGAGTEATPASALGRDS